MTPRPRLHLLAGLAIVVPLAGTAAFARTRPASLPRGTIAASPRDTTRRRTTVPRPRAPMVLSDICPATCCEPGRWTANTRLKVRDEPTDSAALAFHLAPGSVFDATASEVHVDQLGVVVVRRRHAVTDEDGIRRVFQPGDTILVESDLGEGIVLAWSNGEEMVLDGLWWPLDPDEPAPTSRTNAELRRPLVARWWVQVSFEGRDGWLEMSESVDVSGPGCN